MSYKRIKCRVGLAPPSLIGGLKPTLLMVSILLLAGAGAAFADVKLPAVIGDNMVLQQGGKVSIWGWADPVCNFYNQESLPASPFRTDD